MFVSHAGFYFFPNNFFLQIIDKATQQLTSTGIVNYLANLFLQRKQIPDLTKKWKVLTLNKLRFGFIIWLWSCAGALGVFVVEVLLWIAVRKIQIAFGKKLKIHPNTVTASVVSNQKSQKLMTQKKKKIFLE